MSAPAEIYFSADVEYDGPLVGTHSLSSIGMCVAGHWDGGEFTAVDPEKDTWQAQLRPLGPDYDIETQRVSGLDRDVLFRDGLDPVKAMVHLTEWVHQVSVGFEPVLVLHPAVVDWPWLHHYFVRFTGSSPFGHNSAIDVRSLYLGMTDCAFSQSKPSQMPRFLRPEREHTHGALDDALEQAELFVNIRLRRQALEVR